MELEEGYYQLNKISLHVVAAGPAAGEVLLFLHGFPEYWRAWQDQLHFFASRQFRVLAPDQRGYNLSSKPKGRKAYSMQQLTQDIAELIKQLEVPKVHIVGHDWGGAVAWAMAMHYPQLVEKLIILNMPHLQVMKQFLKSRPDQMIRSVYIGFFQVPYLPEKFLQLFNFKMLENSLLRTSRSGTFSKADLAFYKQAWGQAGALKAMINWYRAAPYNRQKTDLRISCPTLLIWGKQDQFLHADMAKASMQWCDRGQLKMITNATHWVQHEKSEQVNQLILNFIQDEQQ